VEGGDEDSDDIDIDICGTETDFYIVREQPHADGNGILLVGLVDSSETIIT
jgi:hypothetical protein